ncbi:hypothetical protein EG329_013462 [Mollisiaceae sp. DMI_Dod_QoI]|nr:hypothetical protein EG329_013462 [Helotiales sp. DMI_Dod_QoI]
MTKCMDVGDANPDIAGIGILLSFCIQAGFTFIISTGSFSIEMVYIYLRKQRALEVIKSRAMGKVPSLHMPKVWHRDAHSWFQIQETTKWLLERNSDIQTATGISLLVSALAQEKTLSFYHLHLVYDTVSLVAISNCGALLFSLDSTAAGIIRYVAIALWAILYLTYTSIFGVRLKSWDYDNPGHCYNTNHLSAPTANHPYVDNIYIAVTCLYVFTTLLVAVMRFNYMVPLELLRYGVAERGRVRKGGLRGLFLIILRGRSLKEGSLNEHKMSATTQYMLLGVAFAQFPLHTYTIFTLRRSNESLLNGSHDEQTWGFSQVGAVVLLAPNLINITIAVKKQLDWERRERDAVGNPSTADMERQEEDAKQLEEDVKEVEESLEALKIKQKYQEIPEVVLHQETEDIQLKKEETQPKAEGIQSQMEEV